MVGTMKSELVGETVTVNGPAGAIVALACEAATGIATCAEFEAVDTDELSATLQAAADDMAPSTRVQARIVLVENGADVMLVPDGGAPAATVEYRT